MAKFVIDLPTDELPSSCVSGASYERFHSGLCPACMMTGIDRFQCCITKRGVSAQTDSRPNWCPLVPCEAITLDEICQLAREFESSPGGCISFVVDGRTYHTDTAYALDGIHAFVDVLTRRHERDEQQPDT